ncbi:hypothetical protein [Primorskyibacter sp. S87]|uniref:hypothetical protein n=1 Tax=Primorskyibacter sp. S87 TaxID=3415126 RepID=UPI003C7C3C23
MNPSEPDTEPQQSVYDPAVSDGAAGLQGRFELGASPDDAAVPPPVFLERHSYRRRRLMDAAKLLPLLGAVLFAIPLLWPTGETPVPGTSQVKDPVRMSVAVLYVFAVWAGLIVASILFAWASRIWGRSRVGLDDLRAGAAQPGDPEKEAR